MERAQRMIELAASGAMCITATDILHLHTDLLPMQLTINQANHHTAVHYMALPENHALSQYIKEGRMYPATHRMPIQELFQAFNIILSEMEKRRNRVDIANYTKVSYMGQCLNRQ